MIARSFLGFLLADIGLAALVALELVGASPPERLGTTPLQPIAPVMAAQAEAESASFAPLSATILARPLFNPNRRPATPAVVTGAPTPATASPRLSGIIIHDKQRLAFFAVGKDGTSVVAEPGSRIGRWRVGAIEPGRVFLTGPKEVYVYPSFAPIPAPDGTPPPAKADPSDSISPAAEAARLALLRRLGG